MRATLAYTSARILLFLAALVLLYVAGLRGLVLLAVALLVSGIASFVVLSKARDRMSTSLSGHLNGMQEKRASRANGTAAKTPGLRARFREFGERLDEGAQAEDQD
jgi:Mn2+/Fe2+ NRAMP family transporter